LNIEAFRNYCLSKKGVTESFPFGEETLVFKVMHKMFALADVDIFESITLKCEPQKALQLRERFPAVQGGYHMNKKHWNTLKLDGTLNDGFILQNIDHSYELVLSGLPKKLRKEWEKLD
jgi:predicted DNA-binding protein (MmcQ/YjbR family)